MHMHGISNSSATFSPNLVSLWPLIQEMKGRQSDIRASALRFYVSQIIAVVRIRAELAKQSWLITTPELFFSTADGWYVTKREVLRLLLHYSSVVTQHWPVFSLPFKFPVFLVNTFPLEASYYASRSTERRWSPAQHVHVGIAGDAGWRGIAAGLLEILRLCGQLQSLWAVCICRSDVVSGVVGFEAVDRRADAHFAKVNCQVLFPERQGQEADGLVDLVGWDSLDSGGCGASVNDPESSPGRLSEGLGWLWAVACASCMVLAAFWWPCYLRNTDRSRNIASHCPSQVRSISWWWPYC